MYPQLINDAHVVCLILAQWDIVLSHDKDCAVVVIIYPTAEVGDPAEMHAQVSLLWFELRHVCTLL